MPIDGRIEHIDTDRRCKPHAGWARGVYPTGQSIYGDFQFIRNDLELTPEYIFQRHACPMPTEC